MNTFVTNNPLFPENIRQALERDPLVMVSGQPSHTFTASGKEFFFDDCEPAIDLPLFVTLAVVKHINPTTHPGLPNAFVGTYPAIHGFSAGLDQYIFGIRPEFGFQILPADTSQ